MGFSGLARLGKKGEGIKKKKNPVDTDNSVVIAREKGGQGEVKEGKGETVMEGDLNWGGEHTIHHTDDAL